MMRKTILFNSRDELLRISVENIVYFEANGNYTNIVSCNKLKSTIGLSLSKTEQLLTEQLGDTAQSFMRVGKRFIVNLNYVFSINLSRQCLLLSDQCTFTFQLPVSKEALRQMKTLFVGSSK
jgi:DNA-binding LytR/AlgR family response regulator